MTQVVFAEEQVMLRGIAPAQPGEQPLELGFLEKLFLDPQGHGHAEGVEAPGGKLDVGLQQPLELEKRLFEEDHIVHFVQANAGRIQAVGDGCAGKASVVLFPREPLFLGSGHDLTVFEDGGCTVVVEG